MNDLLEELYPEITLETDDLIMEISVKKDYSQIKDLDKRKEEFINDLKESSLMSLVKLPNQRNSWLFLISILNPVFQILF